jgi:hypothetical protein
MWYLDTLSPFGNVSRMTENEIHFRHVRNTFSRLQLKAQYANITNVIPFCIMNKHATHAAQRIPSEVMTHHGSNSWYKVRPETDVRRKPYNHATNCTRADLSHFCSVDVSSFEVINAVVRVASLRITQKARSFSTSLWRIPLHGASYTGSSCYDIANASYRLIKT